MKKEVFLEFYQPHSQGISTFGPLWGEEEL